MNVYGKVLQDENLPVCADIHNPPPVRLKTRHPPLMTAKQLVEEAFNPVQAWAAQWNVSDLSSSLFSPGLDETRALHLQRKAWCILNRLRTKHGRCNDMMTKWKLRDDPSCECGAPRLTTTHIWLECPYQKLSTAPDEILTDDGIQ